MSNKNQRAIKSFQLKPIGAIHVNEKEGSYLLKIDKPYRPALKQMDQFSHVMVFWWADKMDTEGHRNIMTTELPYAPGIEAGVFACRAEYRPNPIAVTTMLVLDVNIDSGIVTLPWIDAYDGTPILDLKPYLPISDRIRDYKVASWAEEWPEWMEDATAYFAEHETDFGS
jgi:tRNA-Thr(GGU) m(6)t(6)A37 methyltransferase TsaA